MQTRLLDFYALRTTDNLNTRMEQLFPKCLISGMAASKGSSNYDVTLGLGVWFCDGVAIKESAPQADIVTLDDPSASDRVDVIYGTFAYEADTEQTPASYGVLKGTPAAVPSAPSVGANKVKLVEIYVPSTASDLDDCQIRQSYAQQDQLEMLLSLKIEGNFWAQEELEGSAFDTTLPSKIKALEQQLGTGDIWLNLTDDRFYRGKWTTGTFSWECVSGKKHAATHEPGGDDELSWGDGGGLDSDMVDGEHASAFANASHTHPLSEIEDPSDIYLLGIPGAHPQTAMETGVIYQGRVPPLAINGTNLEIVGITAYLKIVPTSPIQLSYYLEGNLLGGLVLSDTADTSYLEISDTPVCPTSVIRIDAPANVYSAGGAECFFVLKRVTGVDSCGASWDDLTTGGAVPPVDSYRVVVAWVDGDSDQEGDGFYIYRSVDGGAYALYNTVAITTLTFTDNNVENDTTYRYKISEFKELEESALLETNLATIPA